MTASSKLSSTVQTALILHRSTSRFQLGHDLASRIVRYMEQEGYRIFTGPRAYNIVYIEGMNADGSLNNDAPNAFNDRRMVLEIIDGVPKIVGNWQATTEPGYHYTDNPMNPKGAARIKFGQYFAWQVGTHGHSEPHSALIQVNQVSVHRDWNRDMIRTGDQIDSGWFGINQHYGYDHPTNDIYTASAGCLVGRSRQEHREFMALIQQDYRYQDTAKYIFATTIIAGDDLEECFPTESKEAGI